MAHHDEEVIFMQVLHERDEIICHIVAKPDPLKTNYGDNEYLMDEPTGNYHVHIKGRPEEPPQVVTVKVLITYLSYFYLVKRRPFRNRIKIPTSWYFFRKIVPVKYLKVKFAL